MRLVVFSTFFMLNSVVACTQQQPEAPTLEPPKMVAIPNIPFLTKESNFIYVDKISLKPLTNQPYKSASLFTPTGFAIVENAENEYAVIDEHEKKVLDFTSSEISLDVVNGLTFYKKQVEYEKKMPFWKWDWNILGGGITKVQTYRKIEIGVLETKQIILQDDAPYLENSYYLNFFPIDENHLFWNETIYKIKKNRLTKVEGHIIDLLENKRYIKNSGGQFSVYELPQKKVLHAGLTGTETLSIQLDQETITLPEVNKDRYAPEVPKLLVDRKNGDVYPFPQYEKVFPKRIAKATPSQIDFLKKTSLVYSITNTPYFLLGVFNYDDAVWAYDWLYIDTKGNVLDSIYADNFKVLDQVGNIVWPDRKMILPNAFIDKGWKFGKINSYSGMFNLYLIRIENEKEIRTMGLWNSRDQHWEIKPDYNDISVLDAEEQIYALKKEKDGLYTLYDNKLKKSIGTNAYKSINSDGLVAVQLDSAQTIYYYIDIYSGKEYKEN